MVGDEVEVKKRRRVEEGGRKRKRGEGKTRYRGKIWGNKKGLSSDYKPNKTKTGTFLVTLSN